MAEGAIAECNIRVEGVSGEKIDRKDWEVLSRSPVENLALQVARFLVSKNIRSEEYSGFP